MQQSCPYWGLPGFVVLFTEVEGLNLKWSTLWEAKSFLGGCTQWQRGFERVQAQERALYCVNTMGLWDSRKGSSGAVCHFVAIAILFLWVANEAAHSVVICVVTHVQHLTVSGVAKPPTMVLVTSVIPMQVNQHCFPISVVQGLPISVVQGLGLSLSTLVEHQE